MARTKLHRRTMLRGMAAGTAVAIGLPMLEIFLDDRRDARAQIGGTFIPKRFGVFFWGNGNIPTRWAPIGAGPTPADWGLSEQLMPLSNVQNRITVVTNTEVRVTNAVAHDSGAAGIFTGSPLLDTSAGFTFATKSIDQLVADSITSARFKSLVTSCDGPNSWSFAGPNARNDAITSPLVLFDAIFNGEFVMPGGMAQTNPRLDRRRDVLSAVMGDITRLEARLGSADRNRLEQHLQNITELQTRLANLGTPFAGPSCAIPSAPLADYPAIDGRAQLQEMNQAFTDVLAMALACDQTRVFSHWFTRSVTDVLFRSTPTVTIVDGHHRLTHDEGGDQPMVNECVKQVVTALAYMIEKFDSIIDDPTTNATLLDNMVLLATSDCSYGKQHRLQDFPIVLAGSAGGRLVNGMHYACPAPENASKVMVSILKALDTGLESFGIFDGINGGFSNEGLTPIEVV